eukprot:TRINITY_DN3348_c0_g1_i2.p1 TRINITY_DN3348_c0_g1~~TRINITY_DN3348_c0_g1_i2.p1  ORF type:complete len:356 (-),score=83.07 TRINITY_DN3348_c0_g1_i2:1424-2491(-)
MASNRYRVEYAKSGRAKCKNTKCENKSTPIAKDALRIAKISPNSFFSEEGVSVDWFHPECIFDTLKRARATTKKIESPGDLEGYSDLKNAEKDIIGNLIDNFCDFLEEREKKRKKKSPTKKKKAPAKKKKASPKKKIAHETKKVPPTKKQTIAFPENDLNDKFNLKDILSNYWYRKLAKHLYDNDATDDILSGKSLWHVPDRENVFDALNATNVNNLRVIFLGGDPNPQVNNSSGFAFRNQSVSTFDDLSSDRAMRNFFGSLKRLGNGIPSGSIQEWYENTSKQGVLYLNELLSVGTNKASDKRYWRKILAVIFKVIFEKRKEDNKPNNDLLFVLLSENAKALKTMVLIYHISLT